MPKWAKMPLRQAQRQALAVAAVAIYHSVAGAPSHEEFCVYIQTGSALSGRSTEEPARAGVAGTQG